jgi:uncharacterized membrane protein YdjX (TVP38/TMEM64 family)
MAFCFTMCGRISNRTRRALIIHLRSTPSFPLRTLHPSNVTKADRAILFQLLGLLGLAVLVAVVARWLPVAEYVTQAQRKITELEVWGAILYPLLFALVNVLLLPGGILAIGSGLFFGLWWGWFFNVVGATLGAAISLTLARRWGRAWVEKRLHPNGRFNRLNAAVTREGPKIIFLSYAHPLFPTSLLNYLYGLTRIPLRTCLGCIALGQAYLGRFAQSGLRVWRGENHLSPMDWALWIGGLALTLTVTIALARLALRIIVETREATEVEVSTPTV